MSGRLAVEAAGDDDGGLALEPRHEQRRKRVPGREPREDHVAVANLAPQLERPGQGAGLVVVDDLEALRERLAVDVYERVLAADGKQDGGHRG